jgi:hypothetical protein
MQSDRAAAHAMPTARVTVQAETGAHAMQNHLLFPKAFIAV